MGRRLFRWLPPAEEVGEDFGYSYRSISSPALSGWKLRALLFLLESPLSTPLRNLLYRRSDTVQVSQDLHIPEEPMQERVTFFDNLPEPETEVIDPEKDVFSRLDAVSRLIQDFDPLAGTDLGPSGERPKIRDFHRAYLKGFCTPLDVAQKIIKILTEDNIASRPLAWFISWNEVDILRQAKESTERYKAGQHLSILDGIPMAVKDAMDALPYTSTAGTAYVAESRKTTQDSSPVAALKSAGAILIGKSNMHEIGIGVSGLNNIWGTPVNPWNEDRYPGGSSSGSGAIAGSGLCPMAIGSDGGGSTRIPSAFTGCVGLQPTVGRISIDNCVKCAYSVTMHGPMTGCVEDAVIMYSVMAEKGDPEKRVPPLTLPKLCPSAGASPLQGFKMGIYSEWFNHADEQVVTTCRDAVSCLESLGAELIQIRIPELELLRIGHMLTISGEKTELFHAQFFSKPDRHRMNGDVQMSLRMADGILVREYLQAQKIRRRMSLHFGRVMKDIDIILTPTTPITAPKIPPGALKGIGEVNLPLVSDIMRFVLSANFVGLPALSIPVGKDDEGMPIGLQMIGKHWQEATIFRVAYLLEQVLEKESKTCHDPKILINLLHC